MLAFGGQYQFSPVRLLIGTSRLNGSGPPNSPFSLTPTFWPPQSGLTGDTPLPPRLGDHPSAPTNRGGVLLQHQLQGHSFPPREAIKLGHNLGGNSTEAPPSAGPLMENPRTEPTAPLNLRPPPHHDAGMAYPWVKPQKGHHPQPRAPPKDDHYI